MQSKAINEIAALLGMVAAAGDGRGVSKRLSLPDEEPKYVGRLLERAEAKRARKAAQRLRKLAA